MLGRTIAIVLGSFLPLEAIPIVPEFLEGRLMGISKRVKNNCLAT